ncbi:hypothetical protein GGR42_003255 [Saonia flava]|uniref:Uncharacterized protein n=1 Tax=Saonia flava TaxID=523696 RepID=A0A846R5V7_9FLAO|nr:hypothetical protein [Saonia flava]NJB72764.1 hypothetical protein [Saonia flava]
MKKLSFLFLLIMCSSIYGQNQLNEYKYIIVPVKFESFKENNQYQTSTLLKHLFDQKGFNVVYSDNLPKDLSNNMCLGLLADIKDDSNMFTTKTVIVLRDCTFKEIFTSQEGRSRLKQYRPAYAEAITNSFKSFAGMNYDYMPKSESKEPITVSFKNDVKKLEEEVVEIEKDKEKVEALEVEEKKSETVNEIAPIVEVKEEQLAETKPVVMESPNILYAQEIAEGYQLVNSKPSIRLKMYKSSLPNVYHANDDGINGLVLNKNGKWFFEYYKDNKLTVKELNIKF